MSDQHESFLAGMLDRIQSYRWPKKGDRLLMQSQDCENAAEISSDVISRHVHIWDGNMRAGRYSSAHAEKIIPTDIL